MNGTIGLIAVDMDGTLLDADHVTVPPRNVAALRAAAARGTALAIASGRTWSLISDAVGQLGLMDYAILGNGASVRDVKAGRRIYEKGIPGGQAAEIIRILRREDLPFEVYCDGQNYVARSDRERVRPYCLSPEYARLYEKRTCFPDALESALGERPVEKFNLFDVPDRRLPRVLKEVAATGPVAVANSFARNLEIAAGGVSKGAALQALAAHLGLGAEQVMAFGDAGNDLEMLAWAHWSFAMKNGTPEARASARYQAPTNTDAGVGRMVEQYLLNG